MAKRVIALGFFDGVHTGHGRLLEKTVDIAKKTGTVSEISACFRKKSVFEICFDEAFSILPNHLGLHAHSPVKYIENFAEVENAFDAIYSLSHSNLQSDQ